MQIDIMYEFQCNLLFNVSFIYYYDLRIFVLIYYVTEKYKLSKMKQTWLCVFVMTVK